MKTWKKLGLGLVGILLLLTLFYVVGSGFTKTSSVYISEFSLNDDETEMTIQVGLVSSVGYIRTIKVNRIEGDCLFLDCYSAFGGINGSIGAKSTYTIPITGDIKAISFSQTPEEDRKELIKDENGNWQRP